MLAGMVYIRAFVLLALVGGPAWAEECKPEKHAPIPNVIDQPYPAARAKLIASGWQPFLDKEMIDNAADATPAEQWVLDAGYFEVQSCAGTGLGPCRANFIDSHRGWLRVITQSDQKDEHSVKASFFVCGPD